MTSTPSTTERARETAGTAQQESTALAQSAKDSGTQVAQTASAEASNVASEAKAQASDLIRTTRDEVNTQVDAQRRRLAGALRTTGDELGSTGDQSALTAELSQRASTYARKFADYVDEKGPDAILEDVRSFARRRPGTFLLLAGAAGVVAGRVFRSVSAASGSDSTGAKSASFADESATSYSDSTYSGLGVGATETIPPVATTPVYSDDTAVGVAEVPGTGYVPVADPYPPVGEPVYGEPSYGGTQSPIADPYPPTGPGYSTPPAQGESGYPAAPAGAPAADPYPPVPPVGPADDDPYYRDQPGGRP